MAAKAVQVSELSTEEEIVLIPHNPNFKPLPLKKDEIREIWKNQV